MIQAALIIVLAVMLICFFVYLYDKHETRKFEQRWRGRVPKP